MDVIDPYIAHRYLTPQGTLSDPCPVLLPEVPDLAAGALCYGNVFCADCPRAGWFPPFRVFHMRSGIGLHLYREPTHRIAFFCHYHWRLEGVTTMQPPSDLGEFPSDPLLFAMDLNVDLDDQLIDAAVTYRVAKIKELAAEIQALSRKRRNMRPAPSGRDRDGAEGRS